MNIRKSLLTAAIALGCLTMTAQTAGEVTEYVFNPHFYGQLQFGGQETLGEGSFGSLFSPNAQVAFGYQFNKLFGARLGVNAWQSKGILEFTPADPVKGAALISQYPGEGKWKWKYVAPAIDLTFNLTHALGGYNPERLVDVNAFAGVGANIAFKNDEAIAYNNALKAYLGHNGLANIWEGTKARFVGRFGLMCDFRINDNWKVGLEFAANVLNDKYNSKKAGNADWYFNGLVGVKYNFGTSYEKKVIVIEPEIRYVEVPVEKIVEKIVYQEVEPQTNNMEVEVAEPFERNIFFKINSTKISADEMIKVAEIAEYLKNNPGAKVTLMGYADKGTGTPAINMRLAKQRALSVENTLIKTYGIPASRILSDSMVNQDQQPFKTNDMNRVVMAVVE